MNDATSLDELRAIVRCRALPHRVVLRAQIVLAYEECASLRQTARAYQTSVSVVRRWVGRWQAGEGVQVFFDRPRTGRKPRYDLGLDARVLSAASQAPEAFGQVQAQWTQALLAEVVRTPTCAPSRSTIQRILDRQDIDVRKVDYWLFTSRDRPEYESRRDAICALYLGMSALPNDEVVICFDAKPGIQLLADPKGRCAAQCARPAGPASPRRMEFEYKRLGTRGLVAAVRPDTGEVVHAELYHKARRYDSQATIAFLEALRVQLVAKGYRKIHLVLDNGTTHVSGATKAYFEKHAGIFATYFTPVHASWLNLCENFFSTFTRRYLRHRRYTSTEVFDNALAGWLLDHNRRTKPLRWTYAPHQRAA